MIPLELQFGMSMFIAIVLLVLTLLIQKILSLRELKKELLNLEKTIKEYERKKKK